MQLKMNSHRAVSQHRVETCGSGSEGEREDLREYRDRLCFVTDRIWDVKENKKLIQTFCRKKAVQDSEQWAKRGGCWVPLQTCGWLVRAGLCILQAHQGAVRVTRMGWGDPRSTVRWEHENSLAFCTVCSASGRGTDDLVISVPSRWRVSWIPLTASSLGFRKPGKCSLGLPGVCSPLPKCKVLFNSWICLTNVCLYSEAVVLLRTGCVFDIDSWV